MTDPAALVVGEPADLRVGRRIITKCPLNAETGWPAFGEAVTPTGSVFMRNHFDAPEGIDVGWSIELRDATGGPSRLDLDELRNLPEVRLEAVLECAGNGRDVFEPSASGTPWGLGAVSCVRWTGTPLRPVLEAAGVPADAIEVYFEGADGAPTAARYARSLPIAKALDSDVLLAWGMNGRPLPRAFGGPLRLVVPGWYSMASVKWLTRIAFLEKPFAGFFQLGEYVFWPPRGDGRPVREIKVRSLIVGPVSGAEVSREVEIWGWAWSGRASVVRVDVEIDSAAHRATLEAPTGRWAWRRWRLRASLTPGPHRIAARATDDGGEVQPDVATWNSSGYEQNGVHSIEVNAAP